MLFPLSTSAYRYKKIVDKVSFPSKAYIRNQRLMNYIKKQKLYLTGSTTAMSMSRALINAST